MTEVLHDTQSTIKIRESKVIAQGKWQFTTGFAEMDGDVVRSFVWVSRVIDNPTEGDLLKQAQLHLEEIDDGHHVYLETYTIDHKDRLIKFGLGS